MDRAKAHRAWRTAERIKHVSDNIVGIGKFGIGVDGVLAWIPGVNATYSIGAGTLLIYEAMVAKASAGTIAKMAFYLLADSATSAVPVFGWAVDTLFPGHTMAAKVLQKDIEARHGPSELPPSRWRRKVSA
jgi:hypothetical protein